MTVFSNTAPVSTVLSIAGLSSLAAASYSAPSSLVDNTTAAGAYLRGMVRLSFSAALTAGASSPAITLFRLKATDGTNLPNPPGAAASAPAPNALQSVRLLVPSAGFQYIDFEPFDLDPFLYGFQIYNNSGVAFSGTVTATLSRWNIQGV